MYISLHVKYPLFLSDFNENWVLSTDIRKILKYKISRKPLHWEQSRSTRAEGRTDVTKLRVAVCRFAKAPKKYNTLCLKIRIEYQHNVKITNPWNMSHKCTVKNKTIVVLMICMTRKSNPVKCSDFYLLRNVQIGSGAYPVSHVVGTVIISWEQDGRSVELTTHLHLALTLRVEQYITPSTCLPAVKWANFNFLHFDYWRFMTCARNRFLPSKLL